MSDRNFSSVGKSGGDGPDYEQLNLYRKKMVDPEVIARHRREEKLRNDDNTGQGQFISEFSKHVKWILETLMAGVVQLAIGTAFLVVLVAMKFYVWFVFLFAGVLWLLARRLFLWMIPVLLKLTIPIVDVINAILVVFTVVLDVVILAIRAIEDAVNDISGLFDHGHKVFGNIPNYVPIPKITPAEFRDTLQSIPPVCPRYNSPGSVFTFMTRHWLHRYACPATRFLYPVQWAYNPVASALGPWAYYGGSEPFPNTPGQNCNQHANIGFADYICVGLGGGWVILGIALPIILIAILLFSIRGALSNFTKASLYTLYLGTRAAIDSIILFIDMIAF